MGNQGSMSLFRQGIRALNCRGLGLVQGVTMCLLHLLRGMRRGTFVILVIISCLFRPLLLLLYALGKCIACFFGRSNLSSLRPWDRGHNFSLVG